MGKKDYKKAWDRQWRGKTISTCPQFFDAEKKVVRGLGWIDFFSGLSDPSKILDIGTGNGVIPITAQTVAQREGKRFEIHGADLAKISPAKTFREFKDELEKIIIHPETPAENLPFEDEVFDAVTGQHALEYSNLEASIPEVSRVLKSHGKFRFVSHAKESVIVQENISKVEQGQFVLETAHLFEKTREAVVLAAKGDFSGGETLKQALKETYQRFETDPQVKDLRDLLELLWGAYEKRQAFESYEAFTFWLNENKREVEAQNQRIISMVEAALTEQDVKEVKKKFLEAGCDITIESQEKGDVFLGWLLEGHKK